MKNDRHTNIDSSMIDKISILAQLSLTEEEKLLAGEDMVRMLDFFALLSAWDEGSEEMERRTGSDGSEEMEEQARLEETEGLDGFESSKGVEGTKVTEETQSTEATQVVIRNILRRDEVTNKEDSGQLMANAPVQKDGMFVVPLSISAGNGEETSDGQD